MVSTICTASNVNINLPANSILLIDYPQFVALTVGAAEAEHLHVTQWKSQTSSTASIIH